MTLLDLPKRVWISRPQMTLHDIPGLLIFVHNLRIGVKRKSPLKNLHRRISNFDSSSPTSMVLSKLIENFPTSTVTYQLKLYFPTSARTFQLHSFFPFHFDLSDIFLTPMRPARTWKIFRSQTRT